ncbi:MAG: hypothetical protein A2784_02525 [Candidatus Chisholmbacteria bacterium RIFCSPHIGHO2_01_FULL_48_12]|uniref:Glycosyltransferase RgtA/B/C/D-like domain-containing protein n=2 Tax=Microgenomates group TaxID=1794810 RepID=A0A1G1VUT9_9BACT|nr:MAG: hypothetical protein A3F61_01515 [Candidatus Blackburnbacteria bacterium RIFCSPHIGHO2_12_FULL_41_13b]OGY19178.1 MAG: hypothetical protein A2784_02525 [Candidatus Chisholmbacteria bacterium RIFCSPHIGHO2_01_FULL_48_12]
MTGIILVLTIFLRFYHLYQFAGFSWDQEQLLAYPVNHLLTNHKFTLVGPQTGPGGIYLGPLLYYLAAPFFWAFKLHPIAGSVLASTLGVTTATGIYFVFKKFFTQNIALAAFAVYAVSPLLNLNDRTIWNPSLIPLASLGILAVYLTWWKYHHATYLNLALLAAATALGIQAHLSFLFILPLHLLTLLKFKPQLSLLKIGWFILSLIFWFLPLIAFDLRHQGVNVNHFFSFFLSGGSQLNLFSIVSRFLPLIINSLGLIGSMLIYSSVSQFNLLVGIAVLLAAVWLRHYLFLAYMVVFALGFSFYTGNVPDYYLWPLLLPAVLVISLALDSLARRFKIPPLAPISLLLFFLTFKTLDELSTAPPDSLERKLQTVQYIISRSGNQPFQIAYDTDFGRNYGFAYLFDYFNRPPSHDPHDSQFTIVVPELFRTGERSDIAFGSIGIINPKGNSQ